MDKTVNICLALGGLAISTAASLTTRQLSDFHTMLAFALGGLLIAAAILLSMKKSPPPTAAKHPHIEIRGHAGKVTIANSQSPADAPLFRAGSVDDLKSIGNKLKP